ncbi:MAG: hypothetical protein MHMPM18_004954 [Marteilia pararefringens]
MIDINFSPTESEMTKYAIEEFLEIFSVPRGTFNFTGVDLTNSISKLNSIIEKIKIASSNPLLNMLNLDDSIFRILYPSFQSKTEEEIEALKTEISAIELALDEIIADLDNAEKNIASNIIVEINNQHSEINILNDMLIKLNMTALQPNDSISLRDQSQIIHLLSAFIFEISSQFDSHVLTIDRLNLQSLVNFLTEASAFSLDGPLSETSSYKISNLTRFLDGSLRFIEGKISPTN